MPTDIKKVTKAITLTKEDAKYLKEITERLGLSSDSGAVRFIINAYRKTEESK